MKVQIITLPLHTNYGGILQAYALQTVVERMGHQVEVVNLPLCQQRSKLRLLGNYFVRNIKHYLLGKKNLEVEFYSEGISQAIVRKYTDAFVARHIHNRFVLSLEELEEHEADVLLVGSDQVWRKIYAGEVEDYFLYFAKEWQVRRVAYAASFGLGNVDEYSEEDKRLCAELLRRFDRVSVRELSGVDVCRREFGVESQQLLDPTLLLDKADYNHMLDGMKIRLPKGNIFNYVLDDTPQVGEMVAEIERKMGGRMFRFYPTAHELTLDPPKRIVKPVEMWLASFDRAEAVFTDSFHGCVFSIIYNKPFLVLGNKARGFDRFETLLKLTGQEERLVSSAEEVRSKIHLMNIRPNAQDHYSELRTKSLEYLAGIAEL